MTTPARDAAPAEHEQGIGSWPAATPPPQPATAVDAAEIARLRQSVRAWIDGDRILPVDGLVLLAMLDQIQAELAGEDPPTASRGPAPPLRGTPPPARKRETPGAAAEIEAFVVRVQTLIGAGLLATGDGQPLIEVVARVAASLRIAGGIDR